MKMWSTGPNGNWSKILFCTINFTEQYHMICLEMRSARVLVFLGLYLYNFECYLFSWTSSLINYNFNYFYSKIRSPFGVTPFTSINSPFFAILASVCWLGPLLLKWREKNVIKSFISSFLKRINISKMIKIIL